MNPRGQPGASAGWIALALLAAVSAIALARTRAPAARGADAPADEFSVARAFASLRRVLGDEAPHPLGSLAHARVRGRIVAELGALDLQPSIEESFVAGKGGVAAVVGNIVAVVPGVSEGPGVLLCAHYDSVAAGPGAGDDGSGVACLLEIARALVERPPARAVTLLFTDGEEAGLLGAEAFVERHEVAREFLAVVNLEARGTEGPCYFFETSPGNSEIVGAYGRSVEHPCASSVTYEVYKRMPNDTDLTVFKREGLAAANFAFIGGLRRYHTPRDDLAHLSPDSVQHQGEQALALVRALALHGRSPTADGDAVYADLLGLVLLRWPQSWAIPLAIAALAGLAFGARRGSAPFSAILRGMLLAALAVVLAALVPVAIVRGIELARGIDDPWAGHPLPATVALAAGSVAAVALLARAPFFSRAGFEGAWAGAWTLLALAGVAAAWIVPGATVLLLPPTFAAAICGLARARLVRAAFPLAVLALLWVPLAAGLEATAELRAPAVLGAAIGGVLAASGPALALVGPRGLLRLSGAAGGVALLAGIAALLLPSHTPDRPAWLNLVHVEDADAGEARVYANTFGAPLPESLRQRANFSAQPENALPGVRLGFHGYAASSESARAAAPAVELISEKAEDGARTLVVHVASMRAASGLVLLAENLAAADPREKLESGIVSVSWRGQPIDRPALEGGLSLSRPDPGSPWVARGTWVFLGTGPEGIDVRLRAPADGRAVLRIVDIASGLPPTAEALARARPPSCVPRGTGDAWLVLRRVEL